MPERPEPILGFCVAPCGHMFGVWRDPRTAGGDFAEGVYLTDKCCRCQPEHNWLRGGHACASHL